MSERNGDSRDRPGAAGVALFASRSVDLDPVPISYYGIRMSGEETIDGVPVTEEQIASWVVEAEAGYDVEVLKKRGRGRPGRGAEASQVVTLRLTVGELEAIDAKAEREGKTRSDVIREALLAFAA
ncbi:ribbon-helix-helix domain-containing protein [Subtercola sp. YIM 133946]|uniref:ribbon-helix-helix domain-containing protein n=1 Tax=Subtercola sp. YIM 133946 TaxID=3118909 RepID=UPI002F95FA09